MITLYSKSLSIKKEYQIHMQETNIDSEETTESGSNSKTRQRMILITVLVMTFMMTLDSSILNVALPTLAEDLKIPTSLIDWACTAYLISLCSFALIFGRIADNIGKAKIFQLGSLVFTIGSLLCSISTRFVPLILSRFIQGIGASAATSCNLGIITETFPAKNRAKVLSGISSSVALGTLVGPIAGGAILNFFRWETIFLINLPIGIVAFILGVIYLPKGTKKNSSEHFDVGGSLFIFLAISAVISSLSMLQTYSNIYLYMLLILGFVFFIVFAIIEKRVSSPLIKVSLFSNRAFVINLIAIAIAFVSIGTYNILMPFYLQDALQYSPGKAGAIMVAQPIIMAIVAPFAGIFADKHGYRPSSAIGMFVFGCGALFQGLFYNMETSLFFIILGIVIFAAGNAFSQSPNNALVMSSVSQEDYGFAGSTASLVRYMGISVGLTLSTCTLYSLMSQKLGYSVRSYLSSRPDIFIYGLRNVFFGICVILWIASFLMLIEYKKEKLGTHQ